MRIVNICTQLFVCPLHFNPWLYSIVAVDQGPADPARLHNNTTDKIIQGGGVGENNARRPLSISNHRSGRRRSSRRRLCFGEAVILMSGFITCFLQCGYTDPARMYTYWSTRSGDCASSRGRSSCHSRSCWSWRHH